MPIFWYTNYQSKLNMLKRSLKSENLAYLYAFSKMVLKENKLENKTEN